MNRFAAKVAPATPDQTGAPEVREFLTALAIQKVSASTQRQALNALVFYFREVWNGILGIWAISAARGEGRAFQSCCREQSSIGSSHNSKAPGF